MKRAKQLVNLAIIATKHETQAEQMQKHFESKGQYIKADACYIAKLTAMHCNFKIGEHLRIDYLERSKTR